MAVGFPVAVVLRVEHAVNGGVLDVLVLVLVDEVEVTNFVELEETTLVGSDGLLVLEEDEEITIADELEETEGGPVFMYRSSLREHG